MRQVPDALPDRTQRVHTAATATDPRTNSTQSPQTGLRQEAHGPTASAAQSEHRTSSGGA